MFTGIIEEIGTIAAIQHHTHSSQLAIGGEFIFNDLQIGDSVAVNGVCLTVTKIEEQIFLADVMHETLDRSSLGELRCRDHVNLERAMPANGRFGGHIVSGHIDGTGRIQKIQKDENAIWYTISADERLLHYIVEKGSIAIDGISLTVAGISRRDFSVSIIPHTAGNTTLAERKIGDVVNLENDVVGKYIERLLRPSETINKGSQITAEFLANYGY